MPGLRFHRLWKFRSLRYSVREVEGSWVWRIWCDLILWHGPPLFSKPFCASDLLASTFQSHKPFFVPETRQDGPHFRAFVDSLGFTTCKYCFSWPSHTFSVFLQFKYQLNVFFGTLFLTSQWKSPPSNFFHLFFCIFAWVTFHFTFIFWFSC